MTRLIQRILEQHAELRESVEQLREVCASVQEDGIRAGSGFAKLIREFEYHLIAHFGAEESKDAFASVAWKRPDLTARIEQIKAEHQELAEELHELRMLALANSPVAELAHRLRHLLDRFALHEQAESALLRALFAPA